MLRMIVLALLLSLPEMMSAQPTPPPPQNASLLTQLKSAVLARWQALEQDDFQTYAAFFDDGFMMVSADGTVFTKASLLKLVRENQQAGAKEHNSEPVEIRVYGYPDTASMSYKTTNTAPFAGQKIAGDERVVENFVLRSKKWVLVSRAEVPVPNVSRQPVQVDATAFDAYVGQYETGPNSIVKVWREGNRLYEQWPGEQRMRDLPLSENVFYQQGQPGLLNFVRDGSGAVTGFQLWIADSTIVGRKIR